MSARILQLVFLLAALHVCGLASAAAAAAAASGPLAPALSNPPALRPDARSVAAGTNALVSPVTLGTNATAATMDTLDDKHKLAAGDQLSFRIVEDFEDPKLLVVMDSGDLEVPYIGRFPAKDKTCKQLAFQLKAELEKEYYYQATVILAVDVLSKSRGRVYVVGAVKLPGPQDIPSDEVFTVSKAIMRAGGFADFADKRHVKVTRKSAPAASAEEPIIVNVSDIIEKGRMAKDLRLDPDDLIFVPNRLINF